MSTLSIDSLAPALVLKTVEGRTFPLDLPHDERPSVLAFYKVSCPVCQFTFPYLERIYQAHQGSPLRFIGISQDKESDTRIFQQKFGFTFPTLLDPAPLYAASNAFGLTTVPSIFLIENGKVTLAAVGWEKAEMEKLNRRLAELQALPPKALFLAAEQIPASRPG